MSTRATYYFKNAKICFYIHYDGYPEGGIDEESGLAWGASGYFYNMLKQNNTRGGWVEHFFKGNLDKAEFTKGHDAHGDTEYRYTVVGECLIAEKIVDWKTDKWVAFFEGTVVDFITKYLEGADLVTVKCYGRETVLPKDTARESLEHNFSYIKRWIDEAPKHIGNMSSCYSQCLENIDLFNEEDRIILERCRIECNKAYPHMTEYKIPVSLSYNVLSY